jgi:hypothetical protein
MANAAQASGARRWSVGIYGLVVVILAATAYEAAFCREMDDLQGRLDASRGLRL